MTKVVHVGFRHRPDDIRIFQKECVTLAQNGFDVTYITSNKIGDKKNGIYNEVNVCVLPLKKANRVIRLLNYHKTLKKKLIALDAEVYHFHEPLLLPVLLYMHKHRKKVIYDLHEDSPRHIQPYLEKNFGVRLGKILTNVYETYENYCIKKADYIITATPHIAARCKKLNPCVTVVANYPLLQTFNHVGKTKEKMVCYTGGISELNGIYNIVQAMEYVNGGLYLAGNLSPEIQTKLETYPGWKKVHVLGYLSKAQVYDIYKKSAAGLVLYLPSGNTVEALPNKLFEYMEAGIPVIASNFPLWKNLIEENTCGYCVDPQNPLEIASAINSIFRNPQKAHELGENGHRLIHGKYNWNDGGGGKYNKNISKNSGSFIRICYCGGMSKDRNITMYVEMMRYINGKLILIGQLDETYKKELETIDSWNKVEYLGYLSQDEIKSIYEKCDIGLCILQDRPNTIYSWPIKIFEYMAAGLPIICSDFPVWKEIIEKYNCGICIPCNNIKKAIEAVQFLLNNPQIAKTMGENGRKIVYEQFNWEKEAEKIFLVYSDFIN